MQSPKIALTGATSASGLWIAKAFSDSGWTTHSLCSKSEESYSDLKMIRVKWLKTVSEVNFSLRAEKDEFIPWIKKHKPTLWIHHHHHMLNYRTHDYDLSQAFHLGIAPLDKIIEALRQNDCKGIIYSGSYFEATELSPYALSKTKVGEELQNKTSRAGLLFSKVIIPDPTGPLENEDRFLPKAIKASKNSEVFNLQLPNHISDHLPLADLGLCYVEAAKKLLSGVGDIYRPSGLVCTNNDWLWEIEENLLRKLGYKLTTNIALNKSKLASDKQTIDWVKFWENYIHFQSTGIPWRIS